MMFFEVTSMNEGFLSVEFAKHIKSGYAYFKCFWSCSVCFLSNC